MTRCSSSEGKYVLQRKPISAHSNAFLLLLHLTEATKGLRITRVLRRFLFVTAVVLAVSITMVAWLAIFVLRFETNFFSPTLTEHYDEELVTDGEAKELGTELRR